MVLTSGKRAGRAAFTLVELLVVIGLMAVLATISVTGYSAASRGMSDRGAIQNTVSTLRIARQTCQIERVPTKVLFFNQRLTEDASEDDATLYQGTMIAIKQAGRITIPPKATGGLLIDEFADWHQSYPMSNSDRDSSAPGMRIFRMRSDDESKGIEDCSTMVQPCVFHFELNDYMIQAGARRNATARRVRRIRMWETATTTCGGSRKGQGRAAAWARRHGRWATRTESKSRGWIFPKATFSARIRRETRN